MHPEADSRLEQKLFVGDLRGLGDRFGIDFHFPQLRSATGAEILRGHVNGVQLSSGLYLTHSYVDVLQPYESLSTRDTEIFLLIVLEGCVALTLAGQPYNLRPGMALAAKLDHQQAVLHAAHTGNQRLQTLTMTLNTAPYPDSSIARLQQEWPGVANGGVCQWQVPGFLFQLLRQLPEQSLRPLLQQELWFEGLAYQLLAHVLGYGRQTQAKAISPGERRRLEFVREQINAAPHLEYSLEQLAEQAAMSPSSFRNKFRQYVGMSVFDYLREQRLSLARDYLLQGHSVQQAAHLSGYQHATNFATAFRKHFGQAPSELA